MNVNEVGIKKNNRDPVKLLTNLFSVSVAVDPASVLTLTGAVTAGITVTGAAIGDMVNLFPPYDMQGVMAFGYVSAANTVKISFFNPTAGTLDLASGTWTIQVVRK